jgi:hypothetical protein
MQGKGPAVDTAFAMFQRRRQIKQEMGHSANVSVLDRIKLEKSKMDSTAEAMKARTKQVRHPCQQTAMFFLYPICSLVSTLFFLCLTLDWRVLCALTRASPSLVHTAHLEGRWSFGRS